MKYDLGKKCIQNQKLIKNISKVFIRAVRDTSVPIYYAGHSDYETLNQNP